MVKTKRVFPHTQLRAWREHRGLTLDQVVYRLQAEHGVSTTKNSLGRIERGEQPYNPHMNEALAQIYETGSVGALLEAHPANDADIIGLWRRLPVTKRDDAKRILEALTEAASEKK